MLDALIDAGRVCAARGWTPATSGNLSARHPEGGFWITASGLDKGRLSSEDLLAVDAAGVVRDGGRRPSAETGLHAALYAWNAAVGSVVHVHTTHATVLSRLVSDDVLRLDGYEIAKAFEGVTTHETPILVPLLDNDQDIPRLARRVLATIGGAAPGFLLRGHGLYTWGRDVTEALRHAEAFDFLFSCELLSRRLRP